MNFEIRDIRWGGWFMVWAAMNCRENAAGDGYAWLTVDEEWLALVDLALVG